jgi:hypothetical protein
MQLVSIGSDASGSRNRWRSEVVLAAPYLTTDCTKEDENEPDHEKDYSDGPQDRDLRNEADQQEHDTKNDQGSSSVPWLTPSLPNAFPSETKVRAYPAKEGPRQ